MIIIKFLFNTICILTLITSLIVVVLGSGFVLKSVLKEWYGVDIMRKEKR